MSADEITLLDASFLKNEHNDVAYAAFHQGHGSGEKVARDLLVFSISLVYSTFTPLMLPFSLFYFAFGLILHRQQAYYCYARAFESGGDMWRSIVDCVVVCIVVYVLALQGMLLLLSGTLQSFLLTPLLFVILMVHYHLRNSYGSLMKYLAMTSILSMRNRDGIAAVAGSINQIPSKRDGDEVEEEAEVDPETPLMGTRRFLRSEYLDDDNSIAFRAYASEFGGSMGSFSLSNNLENTDRGGDEDITKSSKDI